MTEQLQRPVKPRLLRKSGRECWLNPCHCSARRNVGNRYACTRKSPRVGRARHGGPMSVPDGWGATAGWPPWATTDPEGASEPAAAPGDATILAAPAATVPAAPTDPDRPAAGTWPWPPQPVVPGEMPPSRRAPHSRTLCGRGARRHSPGPGSTCRCAAARAAGCGSTRAAWCGTSARGRRRDRPARHGLGDCPPFAVPSRAAAPRRSRCRFPTAAHRPRRPPSRHPRRGR